MLFPQAHGSVQDPLSPPCGALTVPCPGVGFPVPGRLQLLRVPRAFLLCRSSFAGRKSSRLSPRSVGTSEIRLHKPFTNHLTHGLRFQCVRVMWAGSKQPSRICSGFTARSFSHLCQTSASRATSCGREFGPALSPLAIPSHLLWPWSP